MPAGSETSAGLRLTGRAREFGQLTALLDTATARRTGGTAVLRGEPGIGKTALVAALATHARGLGWAVLEGRGYDLENGLSYGPLAAAVGGYLHRLPAARRAGYTEGLTSLGTLVEGLGEPRAVDAQEGPGRSRLFQSVALLLGRITADAPVLLVLDDLQWADPATVEVLTYLVADLDALGVVLVAALRPLPPGARPDVARLLATMARAPGAVTATLHRLDAAGTAAMATGLLGGPVHPRLAALLVTRSAGTPLVVAALVSDLRARDALVDGPDGWRSTDADPGAPAHLLDIYGAGLARLTEADLRLMEIVSLGGEPIRHELLLALSDLAEPSLDAATERLRVPGLLVADTVHGRVHYAPAHPVVAEAVLAGLGRAARAELHARYLDVLEAAGGAAPDVLARHALGARSVVGPARARDALQAAGRAAMRRGTAVAAAHWLGAAVDVAVDVAAEVTDQDPGDVAALRHDLGMALQFAGDNPAAVANLRTAVEEYAAAGLPARAAAAAADAARLSWLVDDLSTARRCSSEALELAAAAGTEAGARAALDHARLLLSMDDLVALGPALARAYRLAAEVPDAVTVKQLTGHVVFLRAVTGTGSATEALRCLEPPTRPGDPLDLASSNARIELLALLGRWSELDAELELARRLGERGSGSLRMWRSPIARFHHRWLTGDWAGAQDLLTEVDDERIDEVHVLRLLVGLHLGEVTGPDEVAARAGANGAAPRGPGRKLLHLVRSLVAARTGRPEPVPPAWTGMFEWWCRTARVEALAARDDRVGLRAEAADLDRLAGDPATAPAALALRARALAARGSAAGRLAADAVEVFTALGMPFDVVTTRVEAAERGGGGVEEADLAVAEGLGARPLADRVRALLGAPPAGAVIPVLTPREREVAELVADGLSNAAIAERLVVSVRTVTSHLDHAYTKLGIRSRTELAREVRAL